MHRARQRRGAGRTLRWAQAGRRRHQFAPLAGNPWSGPDFDRLLRDWGDSREPVSSPGNRGCDFKPCSIPGTQFMQPAISAHAISKSFRTGIFGAPRRAPGGGPGGGPGEIFGVLGPNGAGKTTLISILATLLRADAGQARVLGLDVIKEARRLRERINLAASGAHFLWCLTTAENLRFYGRLYGLGGRALEAKVERPPGIIRPEGAPPGNLRAPLHRPQAAVILAKALSTTGAAVPGRAHFGAGSGHGPPHPGRDPAPQPGGGLTILLTTHNLREAEMLCGEVAFLKEGRLIARGSIPELQQRLGLGDHLTLIFQDSPRPWIMPGCPGY